MQIEPAVLTTAFITSLTAGVIAGMILERSSVYSYIKTLGKQLKHTRTPMYLDEQNIYYLVPEYEYIKLEQDSMLISKIKSSKDLYESQCQ